MTTASFLIRRSIKSAAAMTKTRIGFPRVTQGCVNIIAYHRIVKDIAKAERESIFGIVISRQTFRRHCEILKRAFDVVSLETAMHFLDNSRRVARPLAAITFDDGYSDFYEEAFPVLNEFGLPATVFVPTELIGKEKPLAHDRIFWLLKRALEKPFAIGPAFQKAGVPAPELHAGNMGKVTDVLVYLPARIRERVIKALEVELGIVNSSYPDEYRLLDWETIREMSRKGINFGSHTANHVVLPLEDEQTMRTEIFDSKATLEEQLGKKVASFAYPNGEHTALIRQLTAEAGYRVAVTTEDRVNSPGADLYALGRTSLCEESTRGIAGRYSPKVAAIRLGA